MEQVGLDHAAGVDGRSVTERDQERENRILRALRGQRPQGLILAASRADSASGGTGSGASELEAFERFGGRVVTFGDVSGAAPEDHGGRSVVIDNAGGAEELGRRMAALGYRAASDKYATLPKVRYPKSEVIKTV